jgi:2-amino-1-hydroxyethylphosphonate dioxygenase (glycine-forming)
MTTTKARSTVDEIFLLYEQFGAADYIGEPVSQLEHMSQSASLAIESNQDDVVVLAAFFHDIGHFCSEGQEKTSMNGFGTKSHEKIGADFLRLKGFPEKLAQLVENHVAAKRYLTFTDSEYYSNLSDASKKTLEFQGGKMTGHEAQLFEKDPLFYTSIQLRKWDELAKEINVPIIDMAILKSKAFKVLMVNGN